MKLTGILPKAALTGLTLFCLCPVQAQTKPDSVRAPETKVLVPVEIKGIRVSNKTPFAVSNLDSQAINQSNGVQDVPYLLNQTPSVNITSDAGAGVGYTALHIRGTDPGRINFTINGIPVNDAEAQTALFVDFPDILSSTNSIQVQRGVGSSTNGSGAFGASVNMSNAGQGPEPYAGISSAAGSFNTLKNSIKAGTGKLKGGFRFDARLSKITSDGYIDRSSSDLKALQFIAGWTSKDERTSVKFNLFTGKEKTGQAWNGVPEDSLQTNRQYNGLGLMANGQYYDDQTDNYQQDYYQLFLNHQFNPDWDGHLALFLTRGKGFYNEYKPGESFADYYRQPFITPKGDTFEATDLTRQLWLDNYFYGLNYALNYHKKHTTLNIGGSLNRYDGKHYGFVTWADYGFPADYRWYHLTAFKNDYSLYAKLQQQVGYNLYLFGDLQVRHVDYQMNGFRENPGLHPDVHYNFLNPKIGLSYIRPHANNAESKLYVSFAVAHKEPNRDDYEASTNELPNPEVLYDGELGYEYHAAKWQTGLNAYYMYYHNQLILTGKINDVGTYTRVNVPTSYRSGLEWTAAWQPSKMLSLEANATFSQNKIKGFHEFIDDYDNGGQVENNYAKTDISFSPGFIAYAQATVEPFRHPVSRQHFYIDLIGKHVGRQYLDNTANKDRSIDPYTLANLRFRYELPTGFFKSLGISLSLNNILNKKYESNGYTYSYYADGALNTENYYFPQAGFNFIAGVDIRF
ncbi:MAG TPA: TonB-dependent receptor plug domain-containing protein [Edaphocola sp.]|nr:TonB-dependent receptor plug domain-containing protein [Edaphocola sp.]